MILLDQDLDPYPATAAVSRTSSAARTSASRASSSALSRLPSTRSLTAFLRGAQAAVRLGGQVSVLLTGDKGIKRLNRRFRGKNKPTDVLSFPSEFPGVAGDLAISVPTAIRQAAEQRHSLAIEIKVLMLHGLLHLAGYDHETDDGRMARRERLLRARLGLPQGLIERSEALRKNGSGRSRKL